MKKFAPAAAVIVLALIAAIWLGEHMTGPEGLIPGVLAAFTAAILAGSSLWRRSRVHAMAIAATSLIVFSLAWAASSRESSLAFNQCVTDGQRVREALGRYRSEHHQFPERLSELSMHLPGRLLFPPHLLRYERTGTGYRLSFSDWLVTYQASDQEAFLAVK